MAFGQMEAKLVLARVFQQFKFELMPRAVHVHMGAALEPRPGVLMRVRRRS
jgi:cytochrome P450